MQLKKDLIEYFNTRGSITFISLGIAGIILVNNASEELISSMGLKPMWILICAIFFYIGNLPKVK